MERHEDPLPVRGEPRLLDWVRDVIRRLRCSVQTEQALRGWDPALHAVPWGGASRGDGGGGKGGVSDRSRGQEQRRVVHTEPRAERHLVLPADIEEGFGWLEGTNV